jgi:hypothetical protein
MGEVIPRRQSGAGEDLVLATKPPSPEPQMVAGEQKTDHAHSGPLNNATTGAAFGACSGSAMTEHEIAQKAFSISRALRPLGRQRRPQRRGRAGAVSLGAMPGAARHTSDCGPASRWSPLNSILGRPFVHYPSPCRMIMQLGFASRPRNAESRPPRQSIPSIRRRGSGSLRNGS